MVETVINLLLYACIRRLHDANRRRVRVDTQKQNRGCRLERRARVDTQNRGCRLERVRVDIRRTEVADWRG